MKKADTGDILLYKGSSLNSDFIRKITRGKFDHVAMILKFESEPGEVYLVDATGNRGVALNRWSFLRDHIGTGEFYEKVVFRHIDFDRNDKMVDNLELFLKEAIGLKYGLGGNKLFRRSTQKRKCSNDRKLIDEERTFFCSELVAKAFKILGITEDDNSSTAKVMPGNFT